MKTILLGCALFIAAVLLSYTLFVPISADPLSQDSETPIPTSPALTNATNGETATKPLLLKAPAPTPEDMVWIPGGRFRMGDSEGAPDKHPDFIDEIPEHNDSLVEHDVELDGFWMQKTEVTNRQFKKFVDATGYVTAAEKQLKREDFVGQVADVNQIKEEALLPGSICFNSKFDPSKLKKDHPLWPYQVWQVVQGASWQHPEGPDSDIADRMDHPVVHVSWDDAMAYCDWLGKKTGYACRLPTEAEWEYAARGGLAGKNYPWGDERKIDGKWPHNIWQGEFPILNIGEDGYKFSAPVGSFPPNGYGLYDMTGNVWEWCYDHYRPDYYLMSPKRNPQGPSESFDPQEPNIPKRVQRGGSFMCSDTYCIGYSVASRMKGGSGSGTFHCGFRCVLLPESRFN